MAKDVKREYVSAKRTEQARATRWSILQAARTLFIEKGYGATTIQAIADDADVAVQTVYAAFGNKREILKQVGDIAVVGDDEPVSLLEREHVNAVAAEPDAKKRARLAAAVIRDIVDRARGITKVMRDAAAVDPEVAELYQAMNADRRQGMRHAAQNLAGPKGKLRVPIDEAADILFALYSADVALLLIDELGWSLDRYEAWLAGVLERTLLP